MSHKLLIIGILTNQYSIHVINVHDKNNNDYNSMSTL